MTTSASDFRRRHARLALLAAAALLAACARSPHQVLHDSYHQDAEGCRARSPLNATATARGGANLAVPPNADVDRPRFLACMQSLGYRQDAKSDPFLKALDKCQRVALKQRGADFDQSAFQSCLKQRGFRPEAGLPPR